MARLLICTQPVDGGVGRHVGDLIAGLRDAGWDVALCGPARPAGVAASVVHVPVDIGRSINPIGDLVAVREVARGIRALRPDIVHVHSSKAGAVGRLARVAHPRTPVVYTPHGYAFAGYVSGSAVSRRLYRGIERSLAPLASRVVCVCGAEARLARSLGPPSRVRVVHNGIDPVGDGPVDPRIAILAGRGPLIGALTQLRPGKGIETLIDALPEILGTHPSALVAVCGDGPDLSSLKARAEMRGVANAIHFLGSTSDPSAALRGIDVFVHPSWAESFPYVILEAMSAGRPVVASNVGGIGEALEDGSSGLLVPKQDPRALATAVTGLLNDPIRRVEIGEAARLRVETRFSRAVMIGGLIDVYDELMAAPHSDDDPAKLCESQRATDSPSAL